MHYYDENRYKKSDLKSASLATAIYVVVAILLFFIITIEKPNEMQEVQPNTLIMDLGTTNIPTPNIASNQRQRTKKQKVEDYDDPEAIRNTSINKGVIKSKKEVDTLSTRAPQKVNTKALYTKKTSISKSNSKNDVISSANEGGSPNGIANSRGDSQSGSFTLSGRVISGRLVTPQYSKNSEGRIIISIKVNREGVVTEATYDPQKSTIANAQMINSACKAAKSTRFSRKSDALFVQVGTITYNFKIN